MSTPHQNNADTSLPVEVGQQQFLLKPLLIGFAASLLAFLFIQLGSEVSEGETRVFDMLMLRGAQSLRSAHPWMTDAMRDLGSLGSTAVLTLFTVTAVGYVALVTSRTAALLVAISVGAGSLLVSVFKSAFGRVRPDASYSEMVVSGLSFPSGHASMAAIVFLTLGALIASTRAGLGERVYILSTAAVMTSLVGLSRIGLGVHWATDVLAGWAFGAAWAIFWLLLARLFATR